ncbi:MAG: protein kinase, partial [Longimicrobiales bacterium]
LDYAHRHKIIHRDIKPANILIHEGRPLIADFGIALAVGVAGGGRLTETGLSVGTPHYMSPEQATGDQAVGVATDIYALGAVLYEMLIGDPPYMGSTAQAILGRIIAGKVASAIEERASVPANVDAAIRKALEKLPADRFTGAEDFANALADPGFRHGEALAMPGPARSASWQSAALVGFGMLLGVAGLTIGSAMRQDAAPAGVMRFTILPPEDAPLSLAGNLRDLAISRDGRQIAYIGPNPGATGPQLNLRAIDQFVGAPLRGGEGGSGPFFSPNGEWVGFVDFEAPQILQKVSTLGGPPVPLAESPYPIAGASWGMDDQIIFGTSRAGLFRVSGGGGEPEVVTTVDAAEGEGRHMWPSIIPGREAVLFVIHGSGELSEGQLAVLDLQTDEVKRLGLVGWSPRYLSTGHLVYAVRDGSIRAVPFDDASLEVTGSPVPLVEGVRVKTLGAANFDVSDDGRLVYALGSATGVGVAPATNLVLVELDGTRSVLAEFDDFAISPRFSPDGLRVAYARSAEASIAGESDLWVLEPSRGAQTRVTFGGTNRYYPIWTPDGTRLVHADWTAAQTRLMSTAADGSGGSDTLLALGDRRFPTSWSADGRTLAYYVGPAGTPTDTRDLWMLHVDGDTATPEPFVETPFMERGAIFSPNGRWIAYVSDKSGQNDVYARPFPGPGVEITISVEGGQEPVWAPSGNALYYRHEDELVVVSVEETEQSLSVGTPRHVLDDRFMRDTGGAEGGVANYDIAPNGEAFVMVEDASSAGAAVQAPQLYVVTNWFEELRQRLGN